MESEEGEHREKFVEKIVKKKDEMMEGDWESLLGKCELWQSRYWEEHQERGKEDKEDWWWDAEVQGAVRGKVAKKEMDRNNNEETKKKYKEAKKWAKRAVARAKAEAYQHLHKAMETPDGLNMALRIAKQRSKNSKEITQPKIIKDEQGNILKEDEDIKSRWHRYFCELLNEENERVRREEDPEVYKREVKTITEDEVALELNKMKNGKAVGPDNIPVEVWKCFWYLWNHLPY